MKATSSRPAHKATGRRRDLRHEQRSDQQLDERNHDGDRVGYPQCRRLCAPFVGCGDLRDPGDQEHRSEKQAGDDDHPATLRELDDEPL